VRVKIIAYTAAGILAGVAGFLGAGYMNFVRGSTFDTFTMRTTTDMVMGIVLIIILAMYNRTAPVRQ
jgi:ribose/xylose/arabinose/galactoside ABC-type transport system permease subunit